MIFYIFEAIIYTKNAIICLNLYLLFLEHSFIDLFFLHRKKSEGIGDSLKMLFYIIGPISYLFFLQLIIISTSVS